MVMENLRTTTPADHAEKVVEKLFQMLPPKEAVPLLNSLLERFDDFDDFDVLIKKIRVEGRGFPPIAVTLGGLMSIAGVIVSYKVFKKYLKFLITSPEVQSGQGFFNLSHQYYQLLLCKGLTPVIVPFNKLPSYGDAEKLLGVLREGAVILNGVSAELATWFGRNAGVGRLVIYRPEDGVGVFRYV